MDSTGRVGRLRRSSSVRYDVASSAPKDEPRFRLERYGEAIQADCDEDAEEVRRIDVEVACELDIVEEHRDIGCDLGE